MTRQSTASILDQTPHLLPGLQETPTELTAARVADNRASIDADHAAVADAEGAALHNLNTLRIVGATVGAILLTAVGIKAIHYNHSHPTGDSTPITQSK